MAKTDWLRIEIPPDHPLADLSMAPELEAAAIEVPGVGDIRFPDFRPFNTALAKARQALFMAAGIEHALLVQYLYSAYSITGANLNAAKQSLLLTAIEEMGHLMTVQNLLLLVRGTPSVKRVDRQSDEAGGGDFDAPVVPFDFMVEPFSKQSLAKYIVAEAPHGAAQHVEPAGLYDKIVAFAGQSHMEAFQHVGTLYLLMGVFFGNEVVLEEKAAADQEHGWYRRVKNLADFIVNSQHEELQAFGGRAGIHLRDEDFATLASDAAILDRQAQAINWDRSVEAAEFRVDAPRSRMEALEALRFISIQGEAATGAQAEDSHFGRFIETFKSVYGDDGQNPEPPGVARVPHGSNIRVATEGPSDDNDITHRQSARWARLADLRYAILLGALEQYLRSRSTDRGFLAGWCFAEMFHLKKLAQFLTAQPRKPDGNASEAAAAVPFSLPERFVGDQPMPEVADQLSPWPAVIADWFTEAVQIATTLLAVPEGEPQSPSTEQRQVLAYMLEVDRRKLLEAQARRSSTTIRTTFDEARELFEFAAGSGDPETDLGFPAHGGMGRFWNRPLQSFKNDATYSPGAALQQLKTGRMPQPDRSQLSPAKIKAVEDWIVVDECKPDVPVRGGIQPVRGIHEVRILPPLAIGRLGSSPEPMDNYTLGTPAADASDDPTRLRELKPAETLVLDATSGEILRAVVPAAVRFRDGMNRIRPVCPFLEVWARFSENGPFELLTEAKLAAVGLTPAAVQWSVEVGNSKMLRRTGIRNDAITASASNAQLGSHQRVELVGRCNNFKANRTITLGWAQYIKPTAEFPGIRLRFTPGLGLVYGHTANSVIPESRAIYSTATGSWNMHSDDNPPSNPEEPRAARSTLPGGIFARTTQGTNLGYFDDSCDGIVKVSLSVNGEEKTALARVSSGPPDFAPQHLTIRSLQDDLEQMILGPQVESVEPDQVIDIVQRAVETVRLLATENENESFPFWLQGAQQMFGANGARYWITRGLHEGLLDAVKGLSTTDPAARQAAVGALRSIRGILRQPRDTWNYSRLSMPGARPPLQQMPALMRGGDGGLLALTQRQLNIIDTAIRQFDIPVGDATPVAAMKRMIQNFSSVSVLHGAVVLPNGGTLADLFADPDSLLSFLADPATVASGRISADLGFAGQRLIVPRDPSSSALLSMVKRTDHPMNSPLTGYTDAVLQINGITVLELWINDLPA